MTASIYNKFHRQISIRDESDVVMARQSARELALEEDFPGPSTEALATAISEVARNIVVHARSGEILLGRIGEGGRRGIAVLARDAGPGIPNIERAFEDGYSTANGLGLGLSGARRLVDDFELVSEVGRGTSITMKKWAR